LYFKNKHRYSDKIGSVRPINIKSNLMEGESKNEKAKNIK